MRMTRDRAISLLRRYRQKELSRPEHYCLEAWTMYEFGERVYTRFIIRELITRIRDAPASTNPLSVIQKFYYWADDMMIDSPNQITKRFTKTIYRIATDISEYLWVEEDYERHRGEIEYYRHLSFDYEQEESNV